VEVVRKMPKRNAVDIVDGRKLLDHLARRRLSQRRLAALIGSDVSVIQDVVHGRAPAGSATIFDVIRLLERTPVVEKKNAAGAVQAPRRDEEADRNGRGRTSRRA
jgi:hypothetical protein